MSDVFPHTVFAVGDRPYCVWDYELKGNNLHFCETLDPNWFVAAIESQLAATDVDTAEELPQPVALSIRLTYHHALETFLAVLFAAFQAPHALPAWLELYKGADLRVLARRIAFKGPILNAWGIPHPSWEDLSRSLNMPWKMNTEDGRATIVGFGRAWSHFAAEYLDDASRAEYNGIKHGFRASPGGSALKIGLGEAPGVPAPPEAMQFIGGSRHGSSVFVLDPIPADTKRGKAHHFHQKARNVLWLAETTIAKVALLAMSINNVLGAVRVKNGVDPKTVRFDRYVDPEEFEGPWRKSTGLRHFGWSIEGPGDGVSAISETQLMARMREASGLDADQDGAGQE